MESWIFLLVGGVGAVGAALVIGTLAALVRLRRDGTLPGQPADAGPPDARTVRALWLRVVVGAAVAAACFASLAAQGLLFGEPTAAPVSSGAAPEPAATADALA